MEFILTPEEAAEQLGIEPAQVISLLEEGLISGFRQGDSWRITTEALIGDLERMRHQLLGSPVPTLAPRSDSPFRILPSTTSSAPRPPEKRGFPQQFAVRIEVDNETDYSGKIVLYLGTENVDGPWDIRTAEEHTHDDAELRVRGALAPNQMAVFFEGTLHGHLGDRLFVSIPEQRGLDEAVEKVFVLEEGLRLRMTLSSRGLLGRRRAMRIKQIPFQDLPRTGTERS